MAVKALKRPPYCWLQHIIRVLVWRSFYVSLLGCVRHRPSPNKINKQAHTEEGGGGPGIETDDNCTVHLFNDGGSSPAGQSHPPLLEEQLQTRLQVATHGQLAMCGSIYIFQAIYHANLRVDLSAGL